MATSPLPSSSAIPPSSPTINPPPPSSVPPPVASLPPKSQPNANSDPPTSSNPSPPSSPPPVSTAPPPSLPTSPPPASQPPLVSPPPPSANSPPPASSSPSLPTLSPPPPSADSPPPASSSPSLPTLSPPPPSASSPSLTLSPPPPSVIPPSISPPPPTLLSPPPPTPISPSPPVGSPPAVVPPPSPSISQSPPPPLAKPPVGSPPTPPSAKPPVSSSPPPPSAKPPESSPTPPVPPSSPPLGPQTPPSVPSAPPTKSRSPPVPSSTPPPPSNSSSGTTPSNPVPSPPTTISPPLPSPALPSGNPATPVNPSDAKKSNSSPNVNVGLGGSNSSGSSGIKTGTAVTIAVVAGFVILSLLGVAVWFVRKRKKHVGGYGGGFVMPSPLGSSQVSESSYPRSPSAPLVKHSSGSHGYMYSPSDPGLGNSKSWFTYGELSDITHGFSNQNLLGEGGFGCVYKGCLPDGREVAVKQLKVGGAQGEREFRAEVETISRVHHRHLVSLVGYCISDNQRLLVYDYVPNNTLYYHLHEEGRPVMDWATRVRVAAGAARGIAYLHEDCHPRVIHRDIKSSNILLDNNFEAQVSDFGLARLAMDACTHVTTRVMGTFGYLAPEYASTGKLTDKSDVYSFGVVLLELVTGRKPVDSCQPLGDESLVEWARPLLSHALENGEFDDLPDPRLEKNYNESEMFRMIEAAAACIRHSAAMRPRMGLVVRALDGLVESDLNNGVKPGQSELFNSAQQSAEIRLFQRMAFGSQEYSSDFSRTSWKSRREL